jgi:hypothetical protein
MSVLAHIQREKTMGNIIDKEELQEANQNSTEKKEIERQKYSQFATEILKLAPMTYRLTSEMETGEKLTILQTWVDRLVLYLDACDTYDVRISNESAYAYLGLTKDQIDAMISGQEPWRPEHFAFATKVKQICAVAREQMVNDSKIPYALAIFQHKVHDNYSDVTTIINVSRNDLDEPKTADELAARYLEKLPIQDDDMED